MTPQEMNRQHQLARNRDRLHETLAADPEAPIDRLYDLFGEGVARGDFAFAVSEVREQLRGRQQQLDAASARDAAEAALVEGLVAKVRDLPGITFEEVLRALPGVVGDSLSEAISAAKASNRVEVVYAGGAVTLWPPGAGFTGSADGVDQGLVLRRVMLTLERVEKRLAAIEQATIARLVPTRTPKAS